MFKALDINQDGSISLDELQVGLKDHPNKTPLLEILKAADTDGSGDINFTEFIAATLDQNIFMNETYIRQAFDIFDANKSGKIDHDKLITLL